MRFCCRKSAMYKLALANIKCFLLAHAVSLSSKPRSLLLSTVVQVLRAQLTDVAAFDSGECV